jgi:hypothetical protein
VKARESDSDEGGQPALKAIGVEKGKTKTSRVSEEGSKRVKRFEGPYGSQDADDNGSDLDDFIVSDSEPERKEKERAKARKLRKKQKVAHSQSPPRRRLVKAGDMEMDSECPPLTLATSADDNEGSDVELVSTKKEEEEEEKIIFVGKGKGKAK